MWGTGTAGFVCGRQKAWNNRGTGSAVESQFWNLDRELVGQEGRSSNVCLSTANDCRNHGNVTRTRVHSRWVQQSRKRGRVLFLHAASNRHDDSACRCGWRRTSSPARGVARCCVLAGRSSAPACRPKGKKKTDQANRASFTSLPASSSSKLLLTTGCFPAVAPLSTTAALAPARLHCVQARRRSLAG
jgi:hypothetical protein